MTPQPPTRPDGAEKVPHTLWYWDERDADHLPVPMSRGYDSEADAVAAAKAMTVSPPSWLAWVKVFRSDNENYVAFTWDRPHPSTPQPKEGS